MNGVLIVAGGGKFSPGFSEKLTLDENRQFTCFIVSPIRYLLVVSSDHCVWVSLHSSPSSSKFLEKKRRTFSRNSLDFPMFNTRLSWFSIKCLSQWIFEIYMTSGFYVFDVTRFGRSILERIEVGIVMFNPDKRLNIIIKIITSSSIEYIRTLIASGFPITDWQWAMAHEHCCTFAHALSRPFIMRSKSTDQGKVGLHYVSPWRAFSHSLPIRKSYELLQVFVVITN